MKKNIQFHLLIYLFNAKCPFNSCMELIKNVVKITVTNSIFDKYSELE